MPSIKNTIFYKTNKKKFAFTQVNHNAHTEKIQSPTPEKKPKIASHQPETAVVSPCEFRHDL